MGKAWTLGGQGVRAMATRNIKTPGEQAPEETIQEPKAEQPSGLPRASDIDPTTITKSVLTQDGWVCPA
jgi:hypothetical protein